MLAGRCLLILRNVNQFSPVLKRLQHQKVKSLVKMFTYPAARRDDAFVEEFHGVKVPDPYHWLQDPDSEETKKFVDDQNALTRPFIENVNERENIQDRLTEIWDYPKYGCPKKKGSRYFYSYNSGLQNQGVIRVQESLESEPRVFLDPNTLSKDGTVSLQATSYSEDGELFAYGLSESGSDWISIKVRNVSTGEDLPECLTKVKYSSIAWTHDNAGFFYSCYPQQEGITDGTETKDCINQKLYYHRVGTTQKEDVLCMEFTDYPHWMMGAEVSHCGNYVILSVQEDCKNNLLFYVDLRTLSTGIQGKLPFKCLVNNLDSKFEYLTNEENQLIVMTNKSSPRYRIVKIDVDNPFELFWKELIPEEKEVLEWASCVAGDKLVLCYLKDVKNVMTYCDLKTGKKLGTFPLEVGTITGFSGDRKTDSIFYSFASFLTPGIIYQCDMTKSTIEPKVFREIKLPNFDSSKYVVKQVYYPSKDGTKIPMYIMSLKEVQGSPAPCLLYGYGGFNVSLLPSFNPIRILFMQNFRGHYAIANIRGGGEFGDDWHDGGRLLNKQNSFDDFETAAEYLSNEGYTTPKQLIIQGASNGGLLMGAVLNQAPNKIGCGIVQVGVLDMLRFHRFTIGRAWCSDYGCSDDLKQFEYMMRYSPLHNVRTPDDSIQYPPTLLLTADHDDRVVPLHSLKFIAELQHKAGQIEHQKQPLMIRIETKAGHGGGKPTKKIIESYTDIFCFIIKTLNIKYFN